ncbi:MAG: 4-alpha-glucanotransferase [bacterium]|nr:4-alpha-glucanotransferase [bacterium]
MSGSRRSGVLLHISSLPGAWGVGDFGNGARRFADFLHGAGFSLWQVLPLTPVLSVFGNSPYSSPSAFAGNPLFISPEELCKDGLVSASQADSCILPSERAADFDSAAACRGALLSRAWAAYSAAPESFSGLRADFERFREEESGWLRDYALFSVLKDKHGGRCWTEWPRAIAARDRGALAEFAAKHEDALAFVEFTQFLFYRQLSSLSAYCAGLGITLMGDLPIYVAWDSADVWARPELFDLEADGGPRCVAGVPPDYFSPTGQRWGNPLYNWEAMRADGFAWWRGRLAHSLKYCGLMRVDHFRGLCAYWEIPAAEKTAQNGCWRPALGREMLEAFRDRDCAAGAALPLVAEDLGIITDDVRALMEDFSLPGMKVLMFAFGGDVAENPYAPHNIGPRGVVYTGTHDNDTAVGWWRGSSTVRERMNFAAYTGQEVTRDDVNRVLVRMALSSTADTAVIPAQDILGLDGSCRMNRPAEAGGNWGWRMLPQELEALISGGHNFSGRLKELNILYGRFKEVN